MGYPPNRTNIGGARSAERLKLLDYCFQTDTLGYHLSVFKPMFPQGLRVRSLFSGIGGAEIALSRLGIYLKSVYSVEPCGLSRSILKRWWQSSGQTGELEQIEDIRSLRAKKLESLVKRFGGFDSVICQNPQTPPDLSKEGSKSEACKFDYVLFNEVVCVSKYVRALMESSWPQVKCLYRRSPYSKCYCSKVDSVRVLVSFYPCFYNRDKEANAKSSVMKSL